MNGKVGSANGVKNENIWSSHVQLDHGIGKKLKDIFNLDNKAAQNTNTPVNSLVDIIDYVLTGEPLKPKSQSERKLLSSRPLLNSGSASSSTLSFSSRSFSSGSFSSGSFSSGSPYSTASCSSSFGSDSFNSSLASLSSTSPDITAGQNVDDECESLIPQADVKILLSDIDDLSDQDIVSVSFALFNSNSTTDLPRIYENIHGATDSEGLNNLKNRIELIKTRLESISVDKLHPIFKTQNDFQKNLLASIEMANLQITNMLQLKEAENIEKFDNPQILRNAKVNEISQAQLKLMRETIRGEKTNIEICAETATIAKNEGASTETAAETNNDKFLQLWNTAFEKVQNLQYNVRKNPFATNNVEETFLSQMPSILAFSVAVDFPPTAEVISPGANAAGIDAVGAAITGLCSALMTLFVNKTDILRRQEIKLHKEYLLKLIEIYHEKGYSLNSQQIKQLKKFFGVKRGNEIINILPIATQSNKTFDKLLAGNQSGKVISTIIDMKLHFKRLIENEDYEGLKRYIQSIVSEPEKAQNDKSADKIARQGNLFKIIFKVNGVRGTILTHLKTSECKKGHEKIKELIINEIEDCFKNLPQLHKINQSNNKPIDLETLGYDEFYIFLKEYTAKDKYTVLVDFSRILTIIENSKTLTTLQKLSLIDCLAKQLINESNDKYTITKIKDKNFHTNALVGILCTQGMNLKKDSLAILGLFTNSYSTIVAIIAGSIGWSIFSLSPQLSTYFSIGETTTSSSLKKMVAATKDRIKNTQQKFIKQDTNIQNSNNEAKAITIQNFSNQLKCMILDPNIHTQNILDMIRKYTDPSDGQYKYSKKYLYSVLTEEYGDTFILDMLYQKINNIHDKDYARNMVEELNKLWADLLLDKEGGLAMDMGLHQFKKIVAQASFRQSTTALLEFYRILGLVGCDNDPVRKAAKLTHFAEVIYRARSDPSSKWHNLRKRSMAQEQLFISLARAAGAMIWGGGSAALLFSGVGLPILIPGLMFLDTLRGLLYGLANNLSHTDTEAYKHSLTALDLNLTDEQKQLLFKNRDIKQLGTSAIYDELHTVVNAAECGSIHNGKLQIKVSKGEQLLSDYMKESIFKAEDNHYLTELNLKCAEDQNPNNPQSKIAYINEIITEISAEAADKHLASQALFRIARIIKLSNIGQKEKLEILINLYEAFKNRNLFIARQISTERDFVTRRNYLIADLLFGLVVSTGALSSIGPNPISGVFQSLAAFASDVIGISLVTLGTDSNMQGSTKTNQESMKFLQYIILDTYFGDVDEVDTMKEVPEVRVTSVFFDNVGARSEKIESEEIQQKLSQFRAKENTKLNRDKLNEIQQLLPEIKAIAATKVGRSWQFWQYGKTNASVQYEPLLNMSVRHMRNAFDGKNLSNPYFEQFVKIEKLKQD